MVSIAEQPSGASLDRQDRAVYEFAGKVATDACSIDQSDVDALRDAGLTDADVADVVFAVAARSFFTRVLDGLGAQLDVQTAGRFSASESSRWSSVARSATRVMRVRQPPGRPRGRHRARPAPTLRRTPRPAPRPSDRTSRMTRAAHASVTGRPMLAR